MFVCTSVFSDGAKAPGSGYENIVATSTTDDSALFASSCRMHAHEYKRMRLKTKCLRETPMWETRRLAVMRIFQQNTYAPSPRD